MRISDWSSDVCSSDLNNGLNASPERDDRYPEHAQWIPQYKTEAVLLEKVQELAPVQIRFNTRFASAQQDEKGVAIRVVSKEDHEQTIKARYLIGADGVRGGVRDSTEHGRGSWRERGCQYEEID